MAMLVITRPGILKQTGLERRIRYHLWQLEPNFRQGSQGTKKKRHRAPGRTIPIHTPYMLTWLGYIDGKCYHIYIYSIHGSVMGTIPITTLLTHVDPGQSPHLASNRTVTGSKFLAISKRIKPHGAAMKTQRHPEIMTYHDHDLECY